LLEQGTQSRGHAEIDAYYKAIDMGLATSNRGTPLMAKEMLSNLWSNLL
jgi:hypothetical protein